jgi:hypothetical protein
VTKTKFNPDLLAAVEIKRMAEAAAEAPEGPFAAEEMCLAYERIRSQALDLYKRSGWGDEEKFNQEIPPLQEGEEAASPGHIRGSMGRSRALRLTSQAERARVLLRQLAAWGAARQETFEIEAGMKARAEAEVKAEAEAKKPRFGKQKAGFEDRSGS